MNPFSPNTQGRAAFQGLWQVLARSLCSHLGMGDTPTPADSTHCLRGHNKSSLKIPCKHMLNPQPRLHEVSYCGPWVITLQLGLSTAVRGSRKHVWDAGPRLTCTALHSHSAHALPLWSLPSFPVLPFSSAASQALSFSHFKWHLSNQYQDNKKGNGWDEGGDTFKYYTTDHQDDNPDPVSQDCPWITWRFLFCLSVSFVLNLTFRFGKFKFRLPSSLRNGNILKKIKVETNQLDIKKEWEAQSILISVSLWIFLFAIFSSYSSQTRKDNWKPTRQKASPNTYTFFP